MNQRGIFLAGTDTAVGKTTVATALIRLLYDCGHRPVPHKPVETGAAPLPTDAIRLRAATNRDDLPLSVVCPISFPDPIAPAAAASALGTTITLPGLLASANRAALYGTHLIVESSGGLLSPYASKLVSADLAAAMHLPLLLISRNSLGTVSHTALAAAEIRRRQLPFLGIILVNTQPIPSPDQPSNPSLIEDLTGFPPLGVLPFVDSASTSQLLAAFQKNIDLRSINAALLT
jgi:dethiobiotin synthetase